MEGKFCDVKEEAAAHVDLQHVSIRARRGPDAPGGGQTGKLLCRLTTTTNCFCLRESYDDIYLRLVPVCLDPVAPPPTHPGPRGLQAHQEKLLMQNGLFLFFLHTGEKGGRGGDSGGDPLRCRCGCCQIYCGSLLLNYQIKDVM